MSYILEALRKVERQRRTREIPDLATVHGGAAAQPGRSWTPIIVGALLANAGLLALLLWYRPWAAPTPRPPAIEARVPAAEVVATPPSTPEAPASATAPSAPAPTSGAPASTAVATAPAPAVGPAPPPAVTAPSVAAPGTPPAVGPSAPSAAMAPAPDPAAEASGPPRARAGLSATAPAVKPRVGGPDLAPSREADDDDDEPLTRAIKRARRQNARAPEAPPPAAPPRAQTPAPTGRTARAASVADLPEPFREAVSQLRLEALVFADSPKDRKVFINGRRYVEGDKLEDGPLVEKIIEEGVVLSYGGQRYVLRHFR